MKLRVGLNMLIAFNAIEAGRYLWVSWASAAPLTIFPNIKEAEDHE